MVALGSYLAQGKLWLPTTHIWVFCNYSNIIELQKELIVGISFATFLNSAFAHRFNSWSFGQFVLYIIFPNTLSALARVETSLILMHACFNQVLLTQDIIFHLEVWKLLFNSHVNG